MSTTSNSLKTILTRDALLEMAGDRYFERGENYFRRRSVHDLAVDGDGLTAQVSGSADYYVELWAEEDQLHATCTCPLGVDDIFCNHCVAVGLTWLANPSTAKTQPSQTSTEKTGCLLSSLEFCQSVDARSLLVGRNLFVGR